VTLTLQSIGECKAKEEDIFRAMGLITGACWKKVFGRNYVKHSQDISGRGWGVV